MSQNKTTRMWSLKTYTRKGFSKEANSVQQTALSGQADEHTSGVTSGRPVPALQAPPVGHGTPNPATPSHRCCHRFLLNPDPGCHHSLIEDDV